MTHGDCSGRRTTCTKEDLLRLKKAVIDIIIKVRVVEVKITGVL